MSYQRNNGDPPQQGPSFTTSTTTTTTHGGTTTTSHSHNGTAVTDFGPHSTTTVSPTVTSVSRVPVPQSQHLQTPDITASPSRSNSQRQRSSSIRIRRPSVQNAMPSPSPPPQLSQPAAAANDGFQGGRRRSSSEPRPPPAALFPDDNDLRRQMTATPLQPVYEDGVPRSCHEQGPAPGAAGPPPSRGPSTRRQAMQRQISALNIRRNHHPVTHDQRNMDSNVVDVLDVIGECSICICRAQGAANTPQTPRSLHLPL